MNEFTSTQNRVIEILTPLVAPLGYEIVHVEVQLGRQKTLRLYIDLTSSGESGSEKVGIEDCVKVSRALDEPLENNPEIDKIFGGAYELEVSSPGVDRPLRRPTDYERFSGRDVRVHVFRPLTAAELENPEYQSKNPKQKNFLGRLVGLRNEKVLLEISSGDAPKKKQKPSSMKSQPEKASSPTSKVSIPLPLIAKANIEPKFDDSFNVGLPAAKLREKVSRES